MAKGTPGNQGIRKKKPSKPALPAKAQVGLPLPLQITRSTFVLNLLVGAIRMMAGVSFWWTVGQGYLLFLLAVLEVWLDPIFTQKGKRFSIAATVALVAVGL